MAEASVEEEDGAEAIRRDGVSRTVRTSIGGMVAVGDAGGIAGMGGMDRDCRSFAWADAAACW